MIFNFKKDKKTTNKQREKTFSLLNYKSTKNLLQFSEPYRNIRTNIEFSVNDKEIKTISITSTRPGEAKSTTALNLAIVFANKYEKILLIDCDLRKPRLHKYLRLSNQYGLSNAVKDFSQTGEINQEYFQTISHKNFVGKLSVITSGKKIANPNEFLSSSTFKKFLAQLRETYDYIIIDCPPVLTVSDAIPIGNTVDGTLFIYSCADTAKQDALSALKLLNQNNVYVLGTVLTKFNMRPRGYYYNYYQYGYHYGYNE